MESQGGRARIAKLYSTLLGAAVWIFVMTLAARTAVNYAAVWAGLLAIPVLLDVRGVGRRLARCWQVLRGAELRGVTERLAFALLTFVLLAHWFVALMPETSADGLAMHLAIPANIAANHAMTFEPSRWVWAVMPMGADFSYAIVYLLGGEYAAHLLDYAMLLTLCAVLYYAMRRWVCRPVSFLMLALFASTPMVQLVTGSLFVENILAAMIVGMMAALWRFSDSGQRALPLSGSNAGRHNGGEVRRAGFRSAGIDLSDCGSGAPLEIARSAAAGGVWHRAGVAALHGGAVVRDRVCEDGRCALPLSRREVSVAAATP